MSSDVPALRFVRANTSKAISLSPRAALSPQRSPQHSPRGPTGPKSSALTSEEHSVANNLAPNSAVSVPNSLPISSALHNSGISMALSVGSASSSELSNISGSNEGKSNSIGSGSALVSTPPNALNSSQGGGDRNFWKSAWRRSVLMASSDNSSTSSDESAENKQLYMWREKIAPVPLTSLRANESVTMVSSGVGHTVFLTDSRRVYTFGNGSHGQLGHGTTASFEQPRQLVALDGTHVSKVAAGGYQTIVVTNEDVLWFGAFRVADKPRLIPTMIESLHGVLISNIAVGMSHALVCSSSGNVFGWGCNEVGQVGPNLPEFVAEPTETDSSRRVTGIAAGDCCSVSILSGSIFFWGSNWIRGKAGVATKPIRVTCPRAVTQVSLGERHLLAVADNKTVYAIGSGDKGQLGNGKVLSFLVLLCLCFSQISSVSCSLLATQL